jgi:hypothetical protein
LNVPYRLKAGTLYSQIPETGLGDFAVTRVTSPANNLSTRVNSLGFIELVNDGVPRLDYPLGGAVNGCPALLVEPSAQNLALHSRDLTNVVWVATNITPVKNAVGADNVASGATTLTATAANATILQSLTHASQSRIFSAYVRRVTGTGTIEMTTNGGTTWTAVTITSSYTRVACAPQTVTNGAVGFRIVTSGDVIVVDFCQGEVGPVATSAIPTTIQAITRGVEVINKTGVSSLIGQTEGTIYAEVDMTSQTSQRTLMTISDGTATNRIRLRLTTATNLEMERSVSGSSNATLNATVPASGVYRVAFGYNASASGFVIYVNGLLAGTIAAATPTFTNQLNSVDLGSNIGAVPFLRDRIRAFVLYPDRLSNSELATLTTP